MSEVKLVLVPQLGVNDERAEVVEWMVEDGNYVSTSDLLCILETTKAAYDVEADSSGYIALLVDKLDSILLGQPLAVITESAEEAYKYKKNYKREKIEHDRHKMDNTIATKKALALAKLHNLQINNIVLKSSEIIRKQDVENYLNSQKFLEKNIKFDISLPDKYTPVVIYGAGKGGVTIFEALNLGQKYRAVCFVDDNVDGVGALNGLPVFRSSDLLKIKEKGVSHVATEIMKGEVRLAIKNKVEELGFKLINIIHPSSIISPSVKMGEGNYIKAGAIIDSNTRIGNCCIIDNGVTIAHDNEIEDGCHIAPGAVFGSSITLGYCTVVGIGASISTNINIGKKCIISTGSSVTKTISDNSVVEGVPGKIIGSAK